MRRRGASPLAGLVLAAVAGAMLVRGTPLVAQETREAAAGEDLTLPPRLDGMDGTPPPARRSRLAGAQEAPEGPIEEVIVVREEKWRLPDLGSAWRAREADRAAADDRMAVDLFPLFDPEKLPPERNPFLINSEMRRVGYIEIFRLRFGRR